ncbi:MAG: hypothetical protein R2911_31370 [Caldilineaceae bacterium]
MTIKVVGDAEIMQEAAYVLMQHMSPTKVARFWAGWQVGHGDYLLWRDETFAGQSVDELYAEIIRFQKIQPASPVAS